MSAECNFREPTLDERQLHGGCYFHAQDPIPAVQVVLQKSEYYGGDGILLIIIIIALIY